LFAGNHAGGFTTGGSLANERLLLGTVGGHLHHTGVCRFLGSIECGASFHVFRDGEVSDVALGVTIRPGFSIPDNSSTSPGITVSGNTLESHEVHDSCLLSSLTDGGEVTTPSHASSFSVVPGFGSLVVNVVFVRLLGDTSVSGPVDVVVSVDNEGSSSFADSDLTSRSSHVPELAVDSELHDVTGLTGDKDGSFGTGSDIDGGLALMVLPCGGSGGLLVDISFFVSNPKFSLGADGDADSSSGLLSPGTILVESEDFLVGGGDGDDAASSGSDILGLHSGGEAHLLPVDTVPSEEFSGGGGDPWSTVGLNRDSGGDLGADLRPALAVPSEGDTVGTDDPDSIVSSDSDVECVTLSSSPLNGLEGVASLAVVSSDS
jgi:hypothetical protein